MTEERVASKAKTSPQGHARNREEPLRLYAALTWLLETSAVVLPAQNLEETLSRYLGRLLDWLEADQGSVMLRQADELAIVACRGLSAEVTPGLRVRLGDGPAGESAACGTPRLLHGALPTRRTYHRPSSSMIIPLRTSQGMVGVLNVGKSSGARPFTLEDLQTTSILALHLAWMLTNFELLEKICSLTITDELTGLYNRRYFNLRLPEEIQRCARHDEPMCVVMADLDGFKELNSHHGHLVGDEILSAVCAAVRQNLRAVDIASRYGGDEISIILPNTSASSAFVLIDRLQRVVADDVFLGRNGVPVKLSLCAGIAQYPGDATDAETLVRKADTALLEAKRTGSRRVLLAD